ncbi:hypothetical protein FHG87_007787 [Trinorchestia longiramus]|nr:hypothetical protein FHG87_007787 [Trinorchestia longiramus]
MAWGTDFCESSLNDVLVFEILVIYPDEIVLKATEQALRRHLRYVSEEDEGLFFFYSKIASVMRKRSNQGVKRARFEERTRAIGGEKHDDVYLLFVLDEVEGFQAKDPALCFCDSECPVTGFSSDEQSKNSSPPRDDHCNSKAESSCFRKNSVAESRTELNSFPETGAVSSQVLKSTIAPSVPDDVLLSNTDGPTGLNDSDREVTLSRGSGKAPREEEEDGASSCSREEVPGKSSSSDYHSGAESCYCPTDTSEGSDHVEGCQVVAHKGINSTVGEKSRQQSSVDVPLSDQSQPRDEKISAAAGSSNNSDGPRQLKVGDDVRRSSGVESARVDEGHKRRSCEGKHLTVKPYNFLLVEKMLQVISLSTQYNSKVRVVTLEIAIQVLKQVVGLSSTSNCITESLPLCNGETVSDVNPVSASQSSSPVRVGDGGDVPPSVPASVVFSASCSCPEATGDGPCVSCSALPRASVASGEGSTAGDVGVTTGDEGQQGAAQDGERIAAACKKNTVDCGSQHSKEPTAATEETRGRPLPSRGPSKVALYDEHLAVLEGAKEEATLVLRNYYKSEEMFLDLFEDEWSHSGCGKSEARRPVSESLRVEYLLQDSNILLPPTATPLTGIQLNKRRPCGEVERARRAMRVFFLVRSACLAVRGEQDTQLPLTRPSACVRVDDVLDLNNSDLIACVVISRDGERCRRFLVIDVLQLILVEPDQRRLGWGVAKFVGFLQYLEVNGDKDDSRVLHLTIHHPASAAAASTASSSVRASSRTAPPAPLLSAKFIFDDHIRCMAAKQRLCKGRNKARQRKLHQIARLLELPSHLLPCPSPPSHPLSAMRLEAHHHHRRGLSGHRGSDGRSGSRSGRSGRVPGRAAHQVHGVAIEGGGSRVVASGSSTSELPRAALGEEIQLEDISGQSLSASQGGHPYLRRL